MSRQLYQGFPRDRKEEAMLAAYGRFLAELAFHKSRRKAILRRIIGILPNGMSKTATIDFSPPEATGKAWMVPIAAVVGFFDASGSPVHRLPALRKKLLRPWTRLFLIDDIDAYPIPAVRSGPGGLYLADDALSLLVLEIFREKGLASLPARFEADPIEACRQPVSRTGTCEYCEEPPLIAS
jgi:hypothetical protein